jgi:hypothetical protein
MFADTAGEPTAATGRAVRTGGRGFAKTGIDDLVGSGRPMDGASYTWMRKKSLPRTLSNSRCAGNKAFHVMDGGFCCAPVAIVIVTQQHGAVATIELASHRTVALAAELHCFLAMMDVSLRLI